MKKIVQILFVCLCVACASILFLQESAHAGEKEQPTQPVVASKEHDRITRILVLGCDRSAHLADAIMIVTVCENSAQTSVLQIPRDTYAEYTTRDYKKLNGILQEKGELGTLHFLSDAIGIALDYFVILDLDCVSSIVDAVGGVDLEIPQEMLYCDPVQGLEIDLHAGSNHLNGSQAEQFIRYRSGYLNADLGRLDAQKLFLRAFVQKCASLTAGEKLRIVLSTLLGLQTNLDLPAAIRMTKLFGTVQADSIPMGTLAGQAVQGRSGAWYYSLNRAGAVRMLNEFLKPLHPLDEEIFDPDGIFDREDHPDFHNIYIAPESCLPLG